MACWFRCGAAMFEGLGCIGFLRCYEGFLKGVVVRRVMGACCSNRCGRQSMFAGLWGRAG